MKDYYNEIKKYYDNVDISKPLEERHKEFISIFTDENGKLDSEGIKNTGYNHLSKTVTMGLPYQDHSEDFTKDATYLLAEYIYLLDDTINYYVRDLDRDDPNREDMMMVFGSNAIRKICDTSKMTDEEIALKIMKDLPTEPMDMEDIVYGEYCAGYWLASYGKNPPDKDLISNNPDKRDLTGDNPRYNSIIHDIVGNGIANENLKDDPEYYDDFYR